MKTKQSSDVRKVVISRIKCNTTLVQFHAGCRLVNFLLKVQISWPGHELVQKIYLVKKKSKMLPA